MGADTQRGAPQQEQPMQVDAAVPARATPGRTHEQTVAEAAVRSPLPEAAQHQMALNLVQRQGGDAARLEEALREARVQVQEIAPPPPPPIPPIPPMPGGLPGAPPGEGLVREGVTVFRDQAGNITVTRDDEVIAVIDPKAVPALQDQQRLIEQVLVPPPPPPFPQDDGPPKGAIAIVAMVLLFLTLMLLGVPLVRAFIRRTERQATGGGAMPADVTARLDRIEQTVEGVAVEMERVAEAQRFSARLLSERLPEALPRLDAAAGRGAPLGQREG